MMTDTITLEQIQEFMDMMTGSEQPDGMTLAHLPKLTDKQAFSIVYYLQERLRIIPDKFELCECGELYDSECDGYTVGEDDEWYEENDILRETVKANEGRSFCSSACEYRFLVDSITREGDG